MRRSCYRVAFFVLVALCLSVQRTAPTWAWGPEGHEIVGQIAADRLSVNAKREVRKLLGSKSLADVANYADAYRLSHPETEGWHFVNIPVDDQNHPGTLDAHRDCAAHNCVVDAITDAEATLSDTSASRDDRILALKFLVHFVGDIHQPLHCAKRRYGNIENDRGGNDVKVRYPGVNGGLKLHKVWDSTIIENELLDGEEPTEYADKLATKLETADLKDKITEWRKAATPEGWANESVQAAADHAYKDVPHAPPADHKLPVLSDQYVTEAKPVVEEQLEKAGVRLADILNGLYP